VRPAWSRPDTSWPAALSAAMSPDVPRIAAACMGVPKTWTSSSADISCVCTPWRRDGGLFIFWQLMPLCPDSSLSMAWHMAPAAGRRQHTDRPFPPLRESALARRLAPRARVQRAGFAREPAMSEIWLPMQPPAARACAAQSLPGAGSGANLTGRAAAVRSPPRLRAARGPSTPPPHQTRACPRHPWHPASSLPPPDPVCATVSL